MVTDMTDDLIVSLYLRRDEDAIRHSDEKYGRLLASVAYNILYDAEDSREAVNDTYLRAWNSIPPTHPTSLGTYLSRITRNLSIDLWRKKSREKHKSEYALSLDELSEVISSGERVEDGINLSTLTGAIEEYLRSQSERARVAFVMRYFFADSVRDIAEHLGLREGAVKSLLHRARLGLREHLIKEGFDL